MKIKDRRRQIARHSIRRFAIFFGIVALFPVCYLVYILFLQSDFYYSLHGVGDGMVTIKTWLDANANGVHDEGESSLPNVCVGYAYSLDDLIRQTGFPCTSRDKTDSEGIGGSDFLPGATGTIYKYTFRPEGYQPTTNMVSIDYSPEFGFVQQGVKLSLKVETVEDYIHNEFIKRWVRYIAFAFFILMIAMYATIRIEKQFFTIESVK